MIILIVVLEKIQSLGLISHFHLERVTDWTFWEEMCGQFNSNKKINVSAGSLGNYCTPGAEGSECVNGCRLHCWDLKKKQEKKHFWQEVSTLDTGCTARPTAFHRTLKINKDFSQRTTHTAKQSHKMAINSAWTNRKRDGGTLSPGSRAVLPGAERWVGCSILGTVTWGSKAAGGKDDNKKSMWLARSRWAYLAMNISDSTEVCYYSTAGALATWGKTHHHKTGLGTNTMQGCWFPPSFTMNTVQIAYPCRIAQWHLVLLLLFYQQTNSISRWRPPLKSMSRLINREKKHLQKAEDVKNKTVCSVLLKSSPFLLPGGWLNKKKIQFPCRSCAGGGLHSKLAATNAQRLAFLTYTPSVTLPGFPVCKARSRDETHTVVEDGV